MTICQKNIDKNKYFAILSKKILFFDKMALLFYGMAG
jgi:hypothetical protein